MGRFIVRRTIGMVFVLFAVSVIVFLIFNVIPNSDPAQRMAGKNATPELVASISEEWGFDESLPKQYLTTMEKIFTGDLVSYESQLNVDEQIVKGIPATFSLCIGAAVLWMTFGILFGYFSATRARRLTDRLLTVLAMIGISMPVFWLSSILLVYFTYKTQIFPTGGYVSITENPVDWAYHLVLPWVTLAVLYVGFYSQVLRSNMLDVMHEDYVRTARAKGLSERRVMTHHVLRNSMIPIVTLFGLDFGALIGGTAIITEKLFNLDGVGLYAAEAIENLDLPPIMAVTIFGAFFVVLFNALVDFLYAYLDPRIRLGSPGRARIILSVRDLRVTFATDGRTPAGGRRRLVRTRSGRDAGDRRRIGLRQERHRADDDRADPFAQRADPGLGAPARRRADRRGGAGAAPSARRPDRDGLPGPDDLIQPGLAARRPDSRGDPSPPQGRQPEGWPGARGGAARRGGDSERQAAGR